MKNKIGLVVISGLIACGIANQAQAQTNNVDTNNVPTNTNTGNMVQALNVRLTAYNQASAGTVKKIRITSKDVINALNGTNVSRGQLLLVTPPGGPDTNGNTGAFLRITSGKTTVVEVPSPDSFNLFQDFAAMDTHGNNTTTYAINRFSIDFGGFHSELQGFSTWHSKSGAASGSFNSTVNGHGTVDGVTQPDSVMEGTISSGAPKAE